MVASGGYGGASPSLFTRMVQVTVAAGALLAVMAWRGGDFVGLWLTPDQQGQRALDQLAFSEAADLFEEPMQKGSAAYDAGRYLEAAAVFGRIPSAQGFYNRGNALMKAREYQQAISAYELAVAEAPDWAQAQANLSLARYVLEYIEGAREQSDTGKMGADDYKFDNTKKSGIDEIVTRDSAVESTSAETWMRSVDTDASDFLRSRFALEVAMESSR